MQGHGLHLSRARKHLSHVEAGWKVRSIVLTDGRKLDYPPRRSGRPARAGSTTLTTQFTWTIVPAASSSTEERQLKG